MSNVTIDRQEWDLFLKDTEELVAKYERLLGGVREMEAQNRLLEERLAINQSQQQKLQKRLTALEKQIRIDSRGTTTIKELRSTVSQLLKDLETLRVG
jgi:predicted nuclease with TOPRIM domain